MLLTFRVRLRCTSHYSIFKRELVIEEFVIYGSIKLWGLTLLCKYVGRSIEWGGEAGGNCYNETTTIDDPTYWGSDSKKSIMQVIGEVFRKSKVPITFLNITQLSNYRKDAHTSIYKKQWNPLTPEQLANPASYADCVHWCLPGLPDTWNELLFVKLFYP